MEYKRQCQSCGMPLDKGEKSGTEKDGSKSTMYCNLCYENGEFLQPNLTLVEMTKTVDFALKEKGWWVPLRWMAKMQLAGLERWKK